jgi:outer membrane protein with beta-barrel domain
MNISSLSARTCRTLVMAALFCGCSAGTARADGLFIPFIGVNFGGDAGGGFGDAVDASRFTWGASLAWMGGGVIGFEGDFGYSHDFFGKTDLGGSSVWTAFGNVLLGVPFGGQQGFGFRPYGLVGIGAVHPDGDAFATQFELSETKVGWDFGGGVMLFFGSHAGIRGDIRYFRTFEALEVFDIEIEDGPGDLDFTRGSVGFVLRF